MFNKIINNLSKNPDFVVKKINIKGEYIILLFFETLCDTKNINDFLLKPLSEINNNNKSLLFDFKNLIEKYIPSFKVNEIKNYTDAIFNLYNGFVILFFRSKCYSLEFRKQLDSGIGSSENEKSIKGPKDSFTENYQTNIGLIRKRIKNNELVLKEIVIGKRSNTKVGILYVNDIANEKLIKKIVNKINKINIDSIPDSNYIYEYISNNKSLFPNVITTERPDYVSYKLLNGKICIVVENTPSVLLLPAFFIEFFHTMDDYYQNNINAFYMRIIRLFAFIITVMLPGIYIALITYNHEIIPPSLIVNFAMQKDGVPFPTVIEALVMNITFEILRETDLRTPSKLGSALSIVGALVLGDAAVQAGLVSPIMVIVIAITAISELIFSTNEVGNSVKIWRLIFIAFAGFSGILGVFIAFILLVGELCSINSFNIPYMYPTSPLNLKDQENNIILSNNYKMKFRNKLTSFKNIKRGEL